MGRCVYACNGDRNCEADCNDDFRQRQLDCPCEVCTLIFHSNTLGPRYHQPQFKKNCIGGCPCPNYSCIETTESPDVTTTFQPDTTTSPTANAVLILNTVNSANMPMVVDFDGQWVFSYVLFRDPIYPRVIVSTSLA